MSNHLQIRYIVAFMNFDLTPICLVKLMYQTRATKYKIGLLLNCAPMRPNAPQRAPTRPVLKKIWKSYYVMFRGSLRLF